jgi:hypothetical protein
MGFIDWMQEKMTGKVLADYGILSRDIMNLEVSATLRQRSNDKYYLVFKWEGRRQLKWEELELSPEVFNKLEAAIRDARAKTGMRGLISDERPE